MQSKFIPHEPSPKQQRFLRLGCLEALYGGRAGCGKSDALLMAAAQGVMIPGYCALLLRRTYKDLALPGALMDRAHSWWADSGAHWSDDKKTWTFPSGARIVFGYLETDTDLDRYQSAEFQFIAPDESSQFSEAQWTFLFSRLRSTNEFPEDFPVRFRGATNPGGQGHEFLGRRFNIPNGSKFARDAEPIVTRDSKNRVTRVFVPAHASDNPGLNWKQYEISLSQLSEVKRRQLRDGEWIQDASELVYSAYPKAKLIDCLPPADGPLNHGLIVDIGASNTTAFAIGAWNDYDPNVYVTSVTEPKDCNTPRDIAKRIHALDDIHHFDFIRGDHGALGKGYLEEMRKYYSIPIGPVQKQDKRGYIDLLNGAIENQQIQFLRGGTQIWQDEASTLLWKDERRLDEMPGMRNHSCDAVLYLWRESRHYSHETKDKSREAMDPVEAAEMQAIDDERTALDSDGCLLPSHYL